MNSLKLAEKRHSVREYKHKKLSHQDKSYLNIQFINKPIFTGDQSLEFIFIEEGFSISEKLEGLAGYFGKMIHAPHYYALLCDRSPLCYKIAGYQGEWLILKALQENIGACWIEVHDPEKAKNLLGITSDKHLVALIAIGYPKKEFQSSSLYASSHIGNVSSLVELGYPNIKLANTQGPVSSRKSITEFLFYHTWGQHINIEDLEKLGIHEALFYMRLAPSYRNRQPRTFLYKEKAIVLIIETDDTITKVIQCLDAGIAMLYFEVGMHDIGINGHWQFDDIKIDDDIPAGYGVAGAFVYL